MLTKKQRELLIFLEQRVQQDGIAPSFEEMKNALGLKSKSGIHRLISGLEERGYIERLPHRARAIDILKSADAGAPLASAPPAHVVEAIAADVTSIPLLGKIAAGTPIEAVRDDGNQISMPADMMGLGEHYALTVDGDSMVEAGIHDGDTVVIKRCDTAENGTIVVALVDDQEVTLKRIRRSGSMIILEPENQNYEPQVLEPGRVQVQGRLVTLMRSYH